MPEKLKQLLLKLNRDGIPIPLLRDPKSGMGSISFTLTIVSATIVAVGLVLNSTKLVEINVSDAEYWFMACAGLYFGRNMSTNSATKTVQLDNKEEK